MKFDFTTLIEGFNNLNDQLRYSILVVVIFIFISLDVFLLVMPQLNSIAGINSQIQKLSDNTEQVVTDKQRIKLMKKNLEITRDQIGSLISKVRPVQEVPAILSTISSIAKDCGVKIDESSVVYDKMDTILTTPDGKFCALPVKFKASCGYHKFGYFLNKLEHEDLFFIMKDFIIQNDEKNPSTHLFSFTIKIILMDKAQTLAKNL